MSQSVNHTYSTETQYEVLVRAGRLPLSLVDKLPCQLSAADQYRVSELFDEVMKDFNFKKFLKDALQVIEDKDKPQQLEFDLGD